MCQKGMNHHKLWVLFFTGDHGKATLLYSGRISVGFIHLYPAQKQKTLSGVTRLTWGKRTFKLAIQSPSQRSEGSLTLFIPRTQPVNDAYRSYSAGHIAKTRTLDMLIMGPQ